MKDCKFCDKKGLLILPLRYAAVVGDATSKALPALPSTVGAKVSDLVLAHAKYAPRLMRNGYLYVLLKRSGLLYWEGYVVTEDAFLSKFPVDYPPQIPAEFSCNRSTCGIDASMIAIDKVEFVEKIYLLFTPTAMTASKLDEYKANPDGKVGKGQMQVFDPKGWAHGSTTQQHSMKPEQLYPHVPEFMLSKQGDEASKSELGKGMKTQLFPAISDAYATPDAAPPGRLGAIEHKMNKVKAAAFVIFDHIGVTQELNDFRNAALEPVVMFLAKIDREKISNQRKLEVMQAIDDVKAGFTKHGIDVEKNHIKFAEFHQLPNIDAENAKTLRGLGRIQEAEKLEERAKRGMEAKEKNRANMLTGKNAEKKWKDKYETLLDMGEKDLFRKTLERISKDASDKSDLRISDHAKWITSDRLVDAFEVYDSQNLGSGFCFNLEHSLCTFGMFGSKKNIHLLKDWMNVTLIERKNLYMRANVFNLKTLQDEAAKAFAEAKQQVAAAPDLSHVAGAPWLKGAKGLIDGFKKTDSAWDEWLRDKVVKGIHEGKTKTQPGNVIHNLSKFHRSAEGLMFARIAEWSQSMSTSSGKMDKAISGTVGMLLYSKLGGLAEKIGFDEYLLKIRPEKIVALKAKQQKTNEYQAAADRQKQTAQPNVNKAEHAARVDASARAKAEAARVEGSIDELIQDEQKKVREKVKLTLDQMDKGERSATNNFRQARMGVLLMTIEGLALTLKLEHFKDTPRVKAEIAASILALTSMLFDLVYAVAKSIREIEPYEKMVGVNKAADVIRGGLKMTAGTLGAAAGGISVVLDAISITDEYDKDHTNWILVGIYFGRAGVGAVSLGLGLIAAFSYCGPLLWRMTGNQLMSKSVFALRFITAFASSAVAAESIAVARTIWLIRLARFNLIGLVITVGEISYRCFIMDDALENWCQACSFRKDKSKGWFGETPFPSGEKELKELEKTFKVMAV